MAEDIRDIYGLNRIETSSLSSAERVQEGLEEYDAGLFFDEFTEGTSNDSFLTQNSANEIITASSLDSDTTEALIGILENIVNTYGESFEETRENNGIIAKAWDWVKNTTGIGAGSNKIESEIETLRNQVAALKEDSSNLAEIYKSVTGNDLTIEELTALSTGEVDFSDSEIINSVSKYQQGQKQSVNIISSIGSALTVTGLIAAGVVAAPFTGGMSLGASLAAIGTLTAAGTAAYMIPQAADGMTEKDGYSAKEIAEDLANGVMSSAFTATGIGAGKAIGSSLASKAATQLGKTAAGLAASEATSVIIGDGIAVGNYLTEAAINDDVDFSWEDLGKTAATATAGSLAAGAAAFGTSSVLRPILTSGTTAQSQIAGRLISSGISGGSAGAAASAASGSTNYLLSCAVNGEAVNFEDWLDSTTENMASGTLTGFCAGVAFEAVQVAAGTPRPEGTKTVQKGTTEEGLKYTDYLDEDGNIIARDIKASDLSNYIKSQEASQEGLVEYNSENTTQNINTTARTVRISFSNIPETIQIDENTSVITGNKGNYYSVDGTIYDWAGNAQSFGSGTIDSEMYNTVNNSTNRNANGTVNSDYVVIDETESIVSNSTNNVPSLIEGSTPVTETAGELSIQTDAAIQQTAMQPQNIVQQQGVESTLIDAQSNTAAGISAGVTASASITGSTVSSINGAIQTGTSGTVNAAQNAVMNQSMIEAAPVSIVSENQAIQIPRFNSVEDAKIYLSGLDSEDAKTVLESLSKLKANEINLDRLNTAIDVLNGGETISQLREYAGEISEEYSSGSYTVDTILEIYKALGIEPDGEITQDKNGIWHSESDKLGVITGRAKGEDSVYSKLKNKMLKMGSDFPSNLEAAKLLIGDAQGTRLVLRSTVEISSDVFRENKIIEASLPDRSDRELFVKYLQGETEGISEKLLTQFDELKSTGLKELSSIQTQKFVDGLSKAIEAGDIRITELHNYYGKDSVPYLSESQVAQIDNAYNEWYKKTAESADTEGSSYRKMTEITKDGEEKEYLLDTKTGIKFYDKLILEVKEKANGYTAAQFNLVNQHNQLEELQFRGSELDTLAEIEHIVYDIKSNKETVSGSEYDDVRNVIRKVQNSKETDSNGKTAMDEYNEYFSAVYRSSRLKEIGAAYVEPDIKDYPLLRALLSKEELTLISVKGLADLHDLIKQQKENK